MFRNKRVKELEEHNEYLRKFADNSLNSWSNRVRECLELARENAELKAELAELEEESEKLFEEITELKAKYTAEVQKNYELVQKIDMLEG